VKRSVMSDVQRGIRRQEILRKHRLKHSANITSIMKQFGELSTRTTTLPDYLLKYKVRLRKLAIGHRTMRKNILESSDLGLVRSISEFVTNVLNGNVPLNSHEREIIRPFRIHLQKLADPDISLKRKKIDILQSEAGIFLPALLSPIIKLLLNS